MYLCRRELVIVAALCIAAAVGWSLDRRNLLKAHEIEQQNLLKAHAREVYPAGHLAEATNTSWRKRAGALENLLAKAGWKIEWYLERTEVRVKKDGLVMGCSTASYEPTALEPESNITASRSALEAV